MGMKVHRWHLFTNLPRSLRATNGSAAIPGYLDCEIAEPALSNVEGVALLPRNDPDGDVLTKDGPIRQEALVAASTHS